MLTKSTTLKFYKRKDIQDEMVKHAKNKEISPRYGDGFGKRPDILTYPREIIELALNNATSFHCSEEIWENPIYLSSDATRKELDELRQGWDLILDIDCKILEYSKICADLIIKFLKYTGVKDVSCKFSGGKGFHVGVPFEAFPKQVGNTLTKNLFPEAPRKIALYIKENIKEELGRRIMAFEQNNFSNVKEKVELPQEEIIRYQKNEAGDNVAKLKVDKFLEIDTILLASRHLYRMPYSLHEKSGLVSLPIDPDKVMEFEKPMVHPDKILGPMFTFLDRNVEESARNLLMQALDFEVKEEKEYQERKERKFEEYVIESPISEEYFPPCIKRILQGMEDGKKRSVFILMNFLGKLGWNKPDIEKFLHDWNKKNPEPLREVYIKGQLNNFKPGAKLPPNCSNESYYMNIGIKCENCQKFKNPVNYALWRWRRRVQDDKESKKEKEFKENMKKEEKKK